jgi:serine/threonine protein kinase
MDLFRFRIRSGDVTQDFFVSTSDELECWVSSFRRLSILNEVRQDYDFIKKLGEGSYASVYKAIDNETGQVVAVKQIAKEKISKGSHRVKVLVNEISCMRRLDHPNILKLERVYENNDFVYLVLEVAEGGDLFEKLSLQQTFNETTCAVLARNLLRPLAYMHEHEVMHRDLKLENILITSDEDETHIKIADFGFACKMTPEDMSMYCGTPGYFAPEVIHKQPYGASADVFSVGVILYILLTGKAPFYEKTDELTFAKNLEGIINFETQDWEHISNDALDFVRLLTAQHADARPSASEALSHIWIQRHNQVSRINRPSWSRRVTASEYKIPTRGPMIFVQKPMEILTVSKPPQATEQLESLAGPIAMFPALRRPSEVSLSPSTSALSLSPVIRGKPLKSPLQSTPKSEGSNRGRPRVTWKTHRHRPSESSA